MDPYFEDISPQFGFEVAILEDLGTALKETTYALEGNEIVTIFAYDIMQNLQTSLSRNYDQCFHVKYFINNLNANERKVWTDKYDLIMHHCERH